MPWTRSAVRIKTGGQELVLSSVTRAGASVSVYSDQALTAAVTLPQAFSADTTFYVAEAGAGCSWYRFNVGHRDGASLAQTVQLETGREIPVVMEPSPSPGQIAAGLTLEDGGTP